MPTTEPTIDSGMTLPASRIVRPVMRVLNRMPSHVDFAADGAVPGVPVSLSRGLPMVDFKPARGTVAKPGQATPPDKVLPDMPGSRVLMGVGFATGFFEAWDEMDARRAEAAAQAGTPTEEQAIAILNRMLAIIIRVHQKAEALLFKKSTEDVIEQRAAPTRFRIRAWTRRA
jgi:hypothetical protein